MGIITELLSHRHDTQMRVLQQQAEFDRATAANPGLDDKTRYDAAERIFNLNKKIDKHKLNKQSVLDSGASHQNILTDYLNGGKTPEGAATAAHGALGKLLPEHTQESWDHFGSQVLPSLGAQPPAPPLTPQLLMQPGSAASPSTQVTQKMPPPPSEEKNVNQALAAPPQLPSPITESTITAPNQSPTQSMPPSQVGSAPSAGFAIPAQPQRFQPSSGGFHFQRLDSEEAGRRAAAAALPALVQKNMAERAQKEYFEHEARSIGLTDPVQIANYSIQKAAAYAPVTNLRPGGVAVDHTGKVLATGGPQFITTPAGAVTTQVNAGQGPMAAPPGTSDGSNSGTNGGGNGQSNVLAAPPALLTPTERAAIRAYAAKEGIKESDVDPGSYAEAIRDFKAASRTPEEKRALDDAHDRTVSTLSTQESQRKTAEINRQLALKRMSAMDALNSYDEDTREMMATKYNAGEKPIYPTGLAGSLLKADIENRAAKQAMEAGKTGEAIVAGKAAMKSDGAALTQLEKQTALVESFASNTDRNFQLAIKLGDRVDRTNSPIVNRWLLKLKGQYKGDKEVAAFEVALNTAATDWAKVTTGQTSGQAVTDSARAKYDQLVSSALSGKSLRNMYTEVVMPELDNRKRSFEDERQKLIGRMSGKQPLAAPPSSSNIREQHSPSTGAYRHSLDGGNTWQPGRAPSQ